ncbi:MAG TPA: DNA polymerase IV [Chloroflexota bacterium]|jgi:DNA polymerase-4|nr:DNA polymerase IV [Chloroflexota bacterium]
MSSTGISRPRRDRVIIHADVDAFYASVEQRDNPALRGRPVAVGGSPLRRGVIMTASYEARQFGVGSAMPSRTAMGLCPHLLIVPARFNAYHEASRIIMEIFRANATMIEPLSLDEAFLDVSEKVDGFGNAIDHARGIKETVFESTRLTVSLGVAESKFVAKIASDFEKPDGLTPVSPNETRAFLAPQPIRRLWGVGPKTEAVLKAAGFEFIGQLADAEDDRLLDRLGPWALRWQLLARGQDDRVVAPRTENKQSSREMTFDRNTRDADQLRRTLSGMAGELARSLHDDGGPPRTVHIKIRYGDFTTITRQRRTGAITSADAIAAEAIALLEQWWDGRPVRLIGVGVSNFVARARDQLSLFDSEP